MAWHYFRWGEQEIEKRKERRMKREREREKEKEKKGEKQRTVNEHNKRDSKF